MSFGGVFARWLCDLDHAYPFDVEPAIVIEAVLAPVRLREQRVVLPIQEILDHVVVEAAAGLAELALAAQLLANVAEGRLIPAKVEEPLTRAARGRRIG